MSEISCNFCNSIFYNKYTLSKHQKTAKFCIQIQHQNKDTNTNLSETKLKEEEISNKFKCLDDIKEDYEKLKKEIIFLKIQQKESDKLKERYNILEDNYTELVNIVNNIIDNMCFRNKGFCTNDVPRKNLIFKDETGNIIEDLNEVYMTKTFIKLNKESLAKLLRKYGSSLYSEDFINNYKNIKELDEFLCYIQKEDEVQNSYNYEKFQRVFINCITKIFSLLECKE